MPQQQPNYEAPLAYEIELGLQRIAAAPDEVALHQELHVAALRYKAEGGRAAGVLEQMKVPSGDPLQRLLHAERIWSLDVNNLGLLTKVLAALAAVEGSETGRDFSAVRRWLYSILSAGPAGS
jgi:hypothetical protein